MINYIPLVLRNVREFKALAETEQVEFETLWGFVYFVLAEQFVETMSEAATARWERIIGLRPLATDTLDERKFAILTAKVNSLPFTYRWLLHRLDFLLGEGHSEVNLDHNNYHLQVLVSLAAQRKFEIVLDMLRRSIPANLVLDASLKYRQHSTLSRWRHGELRPFTHRQLRNKEELT